MIIILECQKREQLNYFSITYLDSSSGNMTVVRQSCCERRSIKEGVLWFSLGHLELLLKGVDFGPISEHLFFLFWEVWLVRH